MNKTLLEKAKQASLKAYAPYSKFKVGAALLTRSGKIYSGCNVENSSYSLTICAERNAIFKAISEGDTEFSELVIFVDSDKLFFPCGACRQVISEFSSDLKITIVSSKEIKETSISELLPFNFHL
ncbi:MAG: cytidine deaminase [Candidatus Cloacimonetes bacterium]|nr:cytidine deaminase [Candidatus Cloacimonadota bacterium]